MIKSSNPAAEKINLVNSNGKFIATENFYIYQGNDGLIYKPPKNDAKNYTRVDMELEISETFSLPYISNGRQ